MNPDYIENLLQVKEIAVFAEHIAKEVNSLNSIDDIDYSDANKIAIEIIARKRARRILKNILGPLINFQKQPESSDQNEYTNDVS